MEFNYIMHGQMQIIAVHVNLTTFTYCHSLYRRVINFIGGSGMAGGESKHRHNFRCTAWYHWCWVVVGIGLETVSLIMYG